MNPVTKNKGGGSTRALTSKQEAFAQSIADGKTGADAYKGAYSAQGMSDNAIYREASLLLDNPKVAQRVKNLKEELANRVLWTREMSVKALAKVYQMAEKDRNHSAMTGAVKELNAMHGYNEPIKLDHTSTDGTMSPPRIIEIVAGKN